MSPKCVVTGGSRVQGGRPLPCFNLLAQILNRLVTFVKGYYCTVLVCPFSHFALAKFSALFGLCPHEVVRLLSRDLFETFLMSSASSISL